MGTSSGTEKLVSPSWGDPENPSTVIHLFDLQRQGRGPGTLTTDGVGAACTLLGVQVAEAAQAVGELVTGREALAGQWLLAGGAHEALPVPGLLTVRDAPAGDGLGVQRGLSASRRGPQGPAPLLIGLPPLEDATQAPRPGHAPLQTGPTPSPSFQASAADQRPPLPLQGANTSMSAGTALPPGGQVRLGDCGSRLGFELTP